MSNGWSLYVIVLTLVCIVGCTWLLFWARTKRVGEPGKGEMVGHNFDGIEEFDSPLPRWWLWLFLGSILFGLAYLVLYPGLSFPGLLGWSSRGQFDEEVQRANAKYGPLYAQYAARPIPDLLKEPQALADKRGFNWASYSKQNVSPRRTLFAEQLSGFIHERMFKGAVGPLAWERGRRLLWCTPPAVGAVGPLWLALRQSRWGPWPCRPSRPKTELACLRLRRDKATIADTTSR